VVAPRPARGGGREGPWHGYACFITKDEMRRRGKKLLRDARRRFLEWVPLTLKMLAGLFSLAGTSPPARIRPVKLTAGRF